MTLICSSRSSSSQGQGHFEVKTIPESNCKCSDFYPEADGGTSTEFILVVKIKTKNGKNPWILTEVSRPF